MVCVSGLVGAWSEKCKPRKQKDLSYGTHYKARHHESVITVLGWQRQDDPRGLAASQSTELVTSRFS